MVKNFGGNKTKAKSRKNITRKTISNFEELKKIDGQEYAHVNSNYGDGRYDLICYDKVKRLGILRGSLRSKSSKLKKGNLVLVCKRSFQDDKCDIVECYTDDHVTKLVNHGEIVESFAKDGIITDKSYTIDNGIISYNSTDQILELDNSNNNDENNDNDNDDLSGEFGIDINDI